MAIDPRAEQAFGSEAEAYERHRPGWPGEAVARALGCLGLGPESEVVDLAAVAVEIAALGLKELTSSSSIFFQWEQVVGRQRVHATTPDERGLFSPRPSGERGWG